MRVLSVTFVLFLVSTGKRNVYKLSVYVVLCERERGSHTAYYTRTNLIYFPKKFE
jgi:hypothetical protein